MHVVAIALSLSLFPTAEPPTEFADSLRAFDAALLPDAKAAARMLFDDARSRRDAANRRSSLAWDNLRSKQAWESFRDLALARLRASLGVWPPPRPDKLDIHVARTLSGRGFRVSNVLFESRPGLVVTANLYQPSTPKSGMPGIVIAHSHHNPKTQSELQEMGIGWARQGCAVIVPDLPGHGERRQHPFLSEKSFPGSFRPGRQDYYFRYNSGLQLHLVGESLCGWIAGDLMRCVDVLCSLPGIDAAKIMLLGSVAGGGDPAAVAAALDPRIAMAAIFNFGGPQPESPFPLPADPVRSFNYAGGGSWESTRNLRLSCRDGFLPWVIVGSIAPRKLIYCHEFAWDRDHDPVWARLEKIWSWYDPQDLAAAHGTGKLSGKPPESSHCNNIGRVHRESMAPALKRWFGLQPPLADASERFSAADLHCRIADTPLQVLPIHELAKKIAEPAVRVELGASEFSRSILTREWTQVLGDSTPLGEPKVEPREKDTARGCRCERFVLEVEPNIHIPVVLLIPHGKAKPAVIVAVAQDGKSAFLRHRATELAALLDSGFAICMPDLRGAGETRPGEGRGRSSSATSISATELMLGRTILGLRLRDLRTVLRYLRTRSDLDHAHLGLWGDSFAEPNPPTARLEAPLDADPQPKLAEPLGAVAALLAALYETDVRCVAAHGGLFRYDDLLTSPFLFVPHDAVPPDALRTGDLPRLAASLGGKPLRLTGMIDGRNVRVPLDVVERCYRRGAYAEKPESLHIASERDAPSDFAAWWRRHLRP